MAFGANDFESGSVSVGGKKEFKNYAVKEFQYLAEYLGSEMKREASFDTKDKPPAEQELVDKVSFSFRILVTGADAALEKMEKLEGDARTKALADFEKKYLEKGHGLRVWLNVNKPTFVNKPAPGKKESGLYTALKGFLNEGEDLTSEQLKSFVGQMNALENKNNDGSDISAEFTHPQFYIYVTKTSSGRNRVQRVIGRVPEEDQLPPFRYAERAADPRSASDNPDLSCEDCGTHLTGYELSRGEDAGKWVSNTEAAQHSTERYGKALCGRCISQVKQARNAGGMPF